MQLAEKELCISNLQEELKGLRSDNSDRLKEIERANSAHQILTKELEEVRYRGSQESLDCAKAKSTIDGLNQQLVQMNEFREQAGCVPNLAHQCGIKDATIADLQQEIGALKAVNQQLQGHQADVENKAIEISGLKARLQSAEATSQHLIALQEELQKYEEEIGPLKDAKQRVALLESDLHQKDDQIDKLHMKTADHTDTCQLLEDLKTQMGLCKYEHKCVEKKLKAAEEEAARAPILENQVISQKDEINELRTRLSEAERHSQEVVEMQAQMDKFAETFSDLNRQLEDAHQAGEELRSMKAANVTLHETITGLQVQAAVAQQVNNSVTCLEEEVQQRDAQIIALRTEMARLDLESQRQKEEVKEANIEDFLDENFVDGACHVAKDSLGQQQNDVYDNDPSSVENGNATKNRRRADRSASYLQKSLSANTSDDQKLVIEGSGCTCSKLSAVQETAADGADRGGASTEKDLDKTDLIPESQPRPTDLRSSNSTESVRNQVSGNILSSSPLSDVGDLFDPSDPDHPANSQHHWNREDRDQIDDTAVRHVATTFKQSLEQNYSISNQKLQVTDSSHQLRRGGGSRAPSSSYGEPLLLDDFEGLGSLPSSGVRNIATGNQTISSVPDVLTSPLGTVPRTVSRQGILARPSVPTRSSSDLNAAGRTEHSQHPAVDASPCRLRSSEPASQTNTRYPLRDLDDDATKARPATPNLPAKEKHQPNSAIKRKSDATGTGDETKPVEKKRARRNLSNMEVVNRQGRGLQSTRSSPDKVGQRLTRLRQSSTSTKSSKSTIVGKNAPAPGVAKHGPKRPRGGSKSEKCLIIIISREY